jgi:hypothetical protein
MEESVMLHRFLELIATRLSERHGLEESLRDYERREFAQGWEGPRWRLPAELRELQKKSQC